MVKTNMCRLRSKSHKIFRAIIIFNFVKVMYRFFKSFVVSSLLSVFNYRQKKSALSIATLSIALLILVLTNSFAQQGEQVYVIDNFSGGQNSHISKHLIGKNQGTEVRNFRVNDQYGSLSKRDTMVLSLTGGSASINGLVRYYKNDATIKTIWATSTGLYYDASGTATALRTGLTNGEWWQFATYKDNVIGWNGSDNAIKWDGETSVTANTDGHRTAGDLCTDLGAPFAELNTGTNLDASSWYQYKVAYYDGTTYSYSTAKSNPILTGAAVYNIYLTDIPIGPTGTTHRYIYRTLGGADRATVVADTTYYRVSTIADNSTRVLADTVTDDTADNNTAPTWATVAAGSNATPPKFEYGTIHHERLFGGNNSTYPSNLYWSDPYNPDYFNTNDYEPIREDDGDEITFVKEYRGLLTIGKTNTILHYYTNADSDSNWYASAPYSFTGCPAPYSVAVTPKGIFYYGYKGIYAYFGQSSALISDAVTDEIRDISSTAIKEVVGYYFNNEYNLAYTSDDSGEAENNRVLVYDLTRDAYVIDYKNINCFESFDAGTDFGVLYSGSSGNDGYIYAHEFSPNILSIRYKSQLDAGTFDDTRSYGEEKEPTLEIAWDCTIDTWLTELQTKDANIDTIDEIGTYLEDAIIDRPDTDGTWTSPAYDLNPKAFDKIYWREDLGVYGGVTFQIRTDDNASMSSPSDYSTAVSDPSGSDLSSITAERYVQIRINLSTTDIEYTPTLSSEGSYLFKLIYSKTGSTEESSFLSKWDSGWRDLSPKVAWKELRRIRVFYQGTSGILNIQYYNQDGNDDNFDIDLSLESGDEENYGGVEDEKVFTHYVEANENGENPIGRVFRFVITEESAIPFSISKIEVKYTGSSEVD